MRAFLSILFASSVLCAAAAGPVTWQFTADMAADGRVLVHLTAICEKGWHIYALELPRDDGPLPTVIRNTGGGVYTVDVPVQEPKAEEVDDPNFGMRVRYHADTVRFTMPVKRLTNAAFDITGEVEFMCCNDQTCLPPQTVKFSVPVPVSK